MQQRCRSLTGSLNRHGAAPSRSGRALKHALGRLLTVSGQLPICPRMSLSSSSLRWLSPLQRRFSCSASRVSVRGLPLATPSGSARQALSRFSPVAAASAAAFTVLLGASLSGYDPLSTHTWSRWDSGWYLTIARRGYWIGHCSAAPHDWCGSAGWFPLYPLAAAGIHLTGIPLAAAALALSWSSMLALPIAAWVLGFERRVSAASLLAVTYLCFAPGQIYYFAIFPLGLLALATVIAVWSFAHGHWWRAGVATAAACLAYPVGMVLLPVAVLWILFARADLPRRRQLRAVVRAGVTPVAAVAAFVGWEWIQSGRWDAYRLVQQHYSHRFQFPFTSFGAALDELVQGSPTAADYQEIFVTAAIVLVVGAMVRRRAAATDVDWLCVALLIAFWTFPRLMANLSYFRDDATLVPLALLFPRLPRSVAIALTVGAVALAVPMEHLFLNGSLV